MRSRVRDVAALILVGGGVLAAAVAVVALLLRGDWPTATALLGTYAVALGCVLGYHEDEPTRPDPGA
ncbi:MAG: hypothetical protein H7Y15_19535 [Pseudonocardia sp.]|nr:hypothetical protein [Pseudonocardia sp.]